MKEDKVLKNTKENEMKISITFNKDGGSFQSMIENILIQKIIKNNC